MTSVQTVPLKLRGSRPSDNQWDLRTLILTGADDYDRMFNELYADMGRTNTLPPAIWLPLKDNPQYNICTSNFENVFDPFGPPELPKETLTIRESGVLPSSGRSTFMQETAYNSVSVNSSVAMGSNSYILSTFTEKGTLNFPDQYSSYLSFMEEGINKVVSTYGYSKITRSSTYLSNPEGSLFLLPPQLVENYVDYVVEQNKGSDWQGFLPVLNGLLKPLYPDLFIGPTIFTADRLLIADKLSEDPDLRSLAIGGIFPVDTINSISFPLKNTSAAYKFGFSMSEIPCLILPSNSDELPQIKKLPVETEPWKRPGVFIIGILKNNIDTRIILLNLHCTLTEAYTTYKDVYIQFFRYCRGTNMPYWNSHPSKLKEFSSILKDNPTLANMPLSFLKALLGLQAGGATLNSVTKMKPDLVDSIQNLRILATHPNYSRYQRALNAAVAVAKERELMDKLVAEYAQKEEEYKKIIESLQATIASYRTQETAALRQRETIAASLNENQGKRDAIYTQEQTYKKAASDLKPTLEKVCEEKGWKLSDLPSLNRNLMSSNILLEKVMLCRSSNGNDRTPLTEENLYLLESGEYSIYAISGRTIRPHRIRAGKSSDGTHGQFNDDRDVIAGPLRFEINCSATSDSPIRLGLADASSIWGRHGNNIYMHPHTNAIYDIGNPDALTLYTSCQRPVCAGEAAPQIVKAGKEKNLIAILNIFLSWCTNADLGDGWGAYAQYFPLWKENKHLCYTHKEILIPKQKIYYYKTGSTNYRMITYTYTPGLSDVSVKIQPMKKKDSEWQVKPDVIKNTMIPVSYWLVESWIEKDAANLGASSNFEAFESKPEPFSEATS